MKPRAQPIQVQTWVWIPSRRQLGLVKKIRLDNLDQPLVDVELINDQMKTEIWVFRPQELADFVR